MNINCKNIIIALVGEVNVNKICDLIDDEKFSFTMLKNHIRKEKINSALKDKDFTSVSNTAKDCNVCKNTIYRKMKKNSK